MIALLSWVLYGLLVGALARAIYPGNQELGFFHTVGLGIGGSYLGGIGHYLFLGASTIEPTSSIICGTIGALALIWGYYKWNESKEM